MTTNNQTRVFIAGDKSSSGKSSICLAITASLLSRYNESSNNLNADKSVEEKPLVSYIKPCTQCIDTQLVWKYCYKHSLPFVGMGPIIYYNGFTSEVQQESDSIEDVQKKEQERMKQIVQSVQQLNSKFVIVDGIGYSSVGSVVGCSNARVAHELDAPVILIINLENGSLGNAIDTFNMNCLYMEHFHRQEATFEPIDKDNNTSKRRVIGVIFNKIPKDLFDQRKSDIEKYFKYHVSSNIHVYGCIPKEDNLKEHSDDLCIKDTCTAIAMSRNDPSIEQQSNLQKKKHAKLQMTEFDEQKTQFIIDLFNRHVNVEQMISDIEQYQNQ
jgi:dethiobiotin synthetase